MQAEWIFMPQENNLADFTAHSLLQAPKNAVFLVERQPVVWVIVCLFVCECARACMLVCVHLWEVQMWGLNCIVGVPLKPEVHGNGTVVITSLHRMSGVMLIPSNYNLIDSDNENTDDIYIYQVCVCVCLHLSAYRCAVSWPAVVFNVRLTCCRSYCGFIGLAIINFHHYIRALLCR